MDFEQDGLVEGDGAWTELIFKIPSHPNCLWLCHSLWYSKPCLAAASKIFMPVVNQFIISLRTVFGDSLYISRKQPRKGERKILQPIWIIFALHICWMYFFQHFPLKYLVLQWWVGFSTEGCRRVEMTHLSSESLNLSYLPHPGPAGFWFSLSFGYFGLSFGYFSLSFGWGFAASVVLYHTYGAFFFKTSLLGVFSTEAGWRQSQSRSFRLCPLVACRSLMVSACRLLVNVAPSIWKQQLFEPLMLVYRVFLCKRSFIFLFVAVF